LKRGGNPLRANAQRLKVIVYWPVSVSIFADVKARGEGIQDNMKYRKRTLSVAPMMDWTEEVGFTEQGYAPL
jgi:hypothetical protein